MGLKGSKQKESSASWGSVERNLAQLNQAVEKTSSTLDTCRTSLAEYKAIGTPAEYRRLAEEVPFGGRRTKKRGRKRADRKSVV